MTVPAPAHGPLESPTCGGGPVLGSTVPRLWTPPLVEGPPGPCGCGCPLTPQTSYGFDVSDFAAILGQPFDPWQRWAAIHLGELLADGRPRFRIVLIIVARQNGKTHIGVVLTLYWQIVEQVPLILGTSTKLDYARESWMKAVDLAKQAAGPAPGGGDGPLAGIIPDKDRDWLRKANGEQESRIEGCRYKVAAANGDAGRSLTVHRGIADELRQHHDYTAWAAFKPAMAAVPAAQLLALSNAGTADSVVLNDHRASALQYIKTGSGNPRLGLFEWSAPDTAEPTDVGELARANPNLGRRLDVDSLLGDAETAVAQGGEALAVFRTESMCQWVDGLEDVVVTEAEWKMCRLSAQDLRERLLAAQDGLCAAIDMSPDERHISLVVAARPQPQDDREEEGARPVLVAVRAAWQGQDATDRFRDEIADVIAGLDAVALGFFPSGPAAGIQVELEEAGFEALDAGETKSACQAFATLVKNVRLLHAGDPMLTDHVLNSRRLGQGDGWRFGRRGRGHVDGAYALAGAVHLARTQSRVRIRVL